MKKVILTVVFIGFVSFLFAQKTGYQLSSHILDITKGQPAAGVTIKLEKFEEQAKTWTFVDEKITDANGRISDFLPYTKSQKGIYRFTYYTSDYFAKNKIESFYPFIEVVFRIADNNHYHVPITLSAFGYSTYRGN